jgi:hypothetical protein
MSSCNPVIDEPARAAVSPDEATIENFRMAAGEVRNIVLVAVSEARLQQRPLPMKNVIHFKATVLRSVKGSWHRGEELTFGFGTEGIPEIFARGSVFKPAPGTPDSRYLLFTNEHTRAEILFDVGMAWRYAPGLEPLLNGSAP